MREIIFRGKRKDNGEWVYGYYEFYNGEYYINVQTDSVNSGGYPIREFIEVIPETVGQYTGLTDKNGTKIFERDIVKEKDVIHNGEIQIKGYTYVVEMADLKPCPFCGGKAELKLSRRKGLFVKFKRFSHYQYVECTECHVRTKPYITTEDALMDWNTRANEKGGIKE